MELVTSADGTAIACERAGAGPPLIVSVGAFCTRQTFAPPESLRRRFTVITYDRRGRGDSGDTQPFAPEREYEDLAAVAAAAGPDVPFVYGHSSGAAIALRAVAAGLPAAGVVAYEAPFLTADAPRPAADPADRIRELVGSGLLGEAVMFWMAEVVRLPGEMLAQADGAPWVRALEPLAPTLLYDLGVTGGDMPVTELEKIAAPSWFSAGRTARTGSGAPSPSRPPPRPAPGFRSSTGTTTTPRRRSSRPS